MVPSGSTSPPEGCCSPLAQQLRGVLPALRTFMPPDIPSPGQLRGSFPGSAPHPPLLCASSSPPLKANKMAPLAPSRPRAAPAANHPPAYQSSPPAPRAPPPRKAREAVREVRGALPSAKSTSDSPVLLQLARFHSCPIQQELTPP